MEYEKPTFLDTKMNQEDPTITPLGFIVVVLVLVAGLAVIAGAAAGVVSLAGAAIGHVAAAGHTVAVTGVHTVTVVE